MTIFARHALSLLILLTSQHWPSHPSTRPKPALNSPIETQSMLITMNYYTLPHVTPKRIPSSIWPSRSWVQWWCWPNKRHLINKGPVEPPSIKVVFHSILVNKQTDTNRFLLNPSYQDSHLKHILRYWGIVSPFKGVWLYSCCDMEIPHSRTALGKLMDDLLQEGLCY